MEIYRKTFAEINLDHLAHNVRVLQNAFPKAPFMCPMIKANAYGHGDVQLAKFLEKLGIQHLGVCLIEEGLSLREAGIKAEVLVFGGFDFEGAQKIIQFQLMPVVSSWEQLDHLEAAATAAVSIHLKFDTGMGRLGFSPLEAQKLFDRLWQNKKIRLKALLTHLYQADDAQDEEGKTSVQLRQLHQVSLVFKPFQIFCHALNSAGALNLMHFQKQKNEKVNHPLLLQNWGLRPGLMIYGYNPLDASARQICDLKPVMTLKSVANNFRLMKIGESVSYGGTWTAKRESIIAVVPIGYADGYHRVLSNQSFVLFNGFRVPVVGNVCMDYIMLDVTDAVKGSDLGEIKNQEVTLFGFDSQGGFLSAEELAKKNSHSITWEILTSVGERVPRIYTGSGA